MIHAVDQDVASVGLHLQLRETRLVFGAIDRTTRVDPESVVTRHIAGGDVIGILIAIGLQRRRLGECRTRENQPENIKGPWK